MTRRERLRARRLPSTPVTVRTDFGEAADAAFAEVGAARQRVLDARAAGLPVGEAQAVLEQAETATEPFVEVLQVHPIPPREYDDLLTAHPPSAEQQKQGHIWNLATFGPALLAACVDRGTDDQLSEAEWVEDIDAGVYAPGELTRLLQTCIDVNDRAPDVQVGKG